VAAPPAAPPPDANTHASATVNHVQARIVSIDPYPGAIVLHLDNGQVWQQADDTAVDLGVRVGDRVTIDRELGSFWITGRNGATAKVRQKH
jgi:hypothetical protein